MTNEELIAKIKAEIERQRKFIEGMFIEGDNNFYDGQDDAYNNILTFLSTLESEKPTKQEKEVKPCHKTRNRLAEWSKTPEGRVAYEKVAEEMRKQIVPNDLEEAAEEYADCNSRRWQEDGDIYYDHPKIVAAFIAGAKWQKEQDEKELSDLLTIAHLQGAEQMKEQMMKDGNVILAEEDFDAEKEKSMEWGYNLCKEQMMKDAMEGEICHLGVDFLDYNISELDEYIKRFKVGDKVRIIIVKEN